VSIDGPLTGVGIIELGGIGPGPFAAMLLAELGADVVRIDRRDPGPLAGAGSMNRSRPNIALDLKHPEAVETVRRLADSADVLIDPWRPGVAERLGLGPADLLARNPRLVFARMTGWGQDGPLAQRAGHDITYAAISGALHLSGTAEKPIAPVNVLADYAGGALYLVIGILAALHDRARTGAGQVVDAAMVDGAASVVSMFYGLYGRGAWRDERGVNLLDGGMPFYDTYECADGGWVAVGALEPQFWAELNRVLGVSFVADQYDPAGFAQQRQTYAAAFRSRPRDEWAALFEGTDACVAPVLGLAEAPAHPHLAARGVFADVDGVALPRVAPRFSAHAVPDPTPERAPGADTTAYLRAHGFSQDEVEALLVSGAAYQLPHEVLDSQARSDTARGPRTANEGS